MNSKRFWPTLLVLSTLSSRYPGVWAQLSTQAVCPVGWSWNQNSLLQDPCEVSSILDAACRGIGSYTIPPLNSTQNYVPPQRDSTADLTCDCDTVMYSLYMSCSSCQGGVIYPWSQWIAQCDTVYVAKYPHDVPYGTAIPHWAFYDVTTLPNMTYSDTVATSAGRDPEATGKPLNTGTLGGTNTNSHSNLFPSTTTSPGSSSDPASNSGSSGVVRKINLAVIIGAAAGGVVVLAVFATILGICISRRNRTGGNQFHHPPPQPLPVQDVSEYQKVQPVSPMLSPITTSLPYNTPASPNPPFNTLAPPNVSFPTPAGQNTPQFNPSYYNPEDPTTFPPPMGDGQSSVTYTNVSGNGSHGPGRYGGAPEL